MQSAENSSIKKARNLPTMKAAARSNTGMKGFSSNHAHVRIPFLDKEKYME